MAQYLGLFSLTLFYSIPFFINLPVTTHLIDVEELLKTL